MPLDPNQLRLFLAGQDALAARIALDEERGLFSSPDPSSAQPKPPETPKPKRPQDGAKALGKHPQFGTVYEGKRGGRFVVVNGGRFYGRFRVTA